jgi:hypothetical protein
MSLSGSTKALAPCRFIVFYPEDKDADCSVLKERLRMFICHGFYHYLRALKETIMNRFNLHDIQYDISESLQNRFIAMRDAGR